ncbi:lipase maturation factor family protein [Pendulispora albinea]|uniref:Lipase maturation factor 2 n=1 Tax=Pendulispora albinea TaxID=2741071 RepID=A0ABZ2M670_9BACT
MKDSRQVHPELHEERARPLVVYDGDCGFCKRWIARFRLRTGTAVDYLPYQEVARSSTGRDEPSKEPYDSHQTEAPPRTSEHLSDTAEDASRPAGTDPRPHIDEDASRSAGPDPLAHIDEDASRSAGTDPLTHIAEDASRSAGTDPLTHIDEDASRSAGTDPLPHIDEDAFRSAVHLVDVDGTVYRGAHAIFRALAHAPGSRWMAMLYAGSPGFARASEAVYAWVAAHRAAASWLTTLFIGRDVRPATLVLTRWIFLRLLGVCAFAAFASLAVQIPGLIGAQGIVPATELPWPHLGNGMRDGTLVGIAWTGAAASALVALDVATGWALLVAWLLYLLLAHVSGPFLSYQWDALLLETCAAALLLAPWRRIRPSLDAARPPGRMALWLLRFLVFKLMFLSGAVKRLSHDPSWRDLTALQFHYWTQPLPTWTSWYVDKLPPWVHTLSARGVFLIELYLPLLIFIPRRGRWLAFIGFVLLQALIAATGNYGFFNLLATALAVLLLDDAQLLAVLSRFAPRLAQKLAPVRESSLLPAAVRAPARRRLSFAAIAATALLVFSAERTWYAVRGWGEEPALFRAVARAVAPLSLVHTYGLFAVMTTSRNEIVVEGSHDGVAWRTYAFKYKPGDPNRAPRFAPLHMPRLDWQMWFFALSEDCSNEIAYIAFAVRLLQGSPAVLDLLERDPFEGNPPRFVRSRLESYRFTTTAERAATGAYWVREPVGDYCSVLERDSLMQEGLP